MSRLRQWYAAIRNVDERRAAPLTGYRELWYTLLVHAVETVRQYPADSAFVRKDLAWLRGAPALLPCMDVCEALGIDHQALVASLSAPIPTRFGPRPDWWTRRKPVGPPRACRACGEPFLPKLSNQLYCCHTHQHRTCSRERRARLRMAQEVA